MIKKSLVLMVSESYDENEVAVSVRTTTDGSGNVVLESVSTKYSANPSELQEALVLASMFMEQNNYASNKSKPDSPDNHPDNHDDLTPMEIPF